MSRWLDRQLLALLSLPAAMLADLLLGRGVPVSGFVEALSSPNTLEGQILWLVRGPRVATAMIAGAALGVAGVVLQAVLRNPLASPDTTGINTSAVLGVVIVIAFALVPTDSATGFALAGLAGGLLGGAAAYLLGARLSAQRQLLAGMMLAAAMSGAVTLFLSLRTSRFASVVRWLVGSVDGRVWHDLIWAGAWVGLWTITLTLASGLLPIVSAGDEHAAAMGLRPRRVRAALLISAAAVASGAAALAGAITFVGLVVPHLVRRTGFRGAALIPAAAVTGAALLTGCDALAQLLTRALTGAGVSERVGLPAGAVAAVVGAATLIVMLRRQSTG